MTSPFCTTESFFLLGVVVLLLGFAHARIKGPYPNGVPGSGYGCNNRCRKNADVNYVITGRIREYRVPGTANNPEAPLNEFTRPPGAEQSMLTRTWVGDVEKSSPFCFGENGRSGPIGPCLQVKPGQLMKIKIINRMNDGMEELRQRSSTKADYFGISQILDSLGRTFGPNPETPEDMVVENIENMAGQDIPGEFDTTNLHTHGLHVATHMFYPQGTGDPKAHWIDVTPPNINATQSCFCYVFQIPEAHPEGAYWYHVHRHGSSAIQARQGMAGLLLVTGGAHDPLDRLEEQGITRHIPFPLWQWRADQTKTLADIGKHNTFLPPDTLATFAGLDTYLVGNEYQPTYEMCVGETVNLIFLNAAATTGVGVYIYDEDDQLTTFWRYASDGVTYDKAYSFTSLLIMSGMREGLLLQFSQPGRYRMRQGIFFATQTIGTPETNNAFFEVSDDPYKCGPIDPIDMDSLTFTPGVEAGDIDREEILLERNIAFGVGFDADIAPIPEFTIDNVLFETERIDSFEDVQTAAAWTIVANQPAFHPLHVHINPVQVKTMNMGVPSLATGTDLNPNGTMADGQIIILNLALDSMLRPANMWRDVVIVPATGLIEIWQRFGNKGEGEIAWAGKSVFHCHFLDHEDEGMMSNFIVERRRPPNNGQP